VREEKELIGNKMNSMNPANAINGIFMLKADF